MTLNQRIMWTALPNGMSPDGTKLLLTVFVSPRLFTDEGPLTERLSHFPDFINWTGRHITFSVAIGPDTPTPVTVVSPARQAVLWEAMFHSMTFVQPYIYSSLAAENFHSYPAKFIRDWFVNTYSTLANTTPTEYPTLTQLGLGAGPTAPYGGLPFNADETQRAIGIIDSLLSQGVSNPFGGPAVHAIGPASAPDPLTDFEQAELFLSPLTTETAVYNPNAHPPKPQIDFHRMVSTLGQYPALLRLFGLAFDLEVPVPGSGVPSPAPVTVTPTWTPLLAATTNITPATYADPTTFLPLPRSTNPELAGGLLRMSDPVPSEPTQPAYPPVELELDGSTLKTLNFARGIYRATTSMSSSSTPSSYAPPALRSAGLAVAHTGQALDFGQGMQQSDSLDAAAELNNPIFLYAEDIARGARIDVWDDATNAWHQLCARSAVPSVGGYVIGLVPNSHVVPVPSGDEGWIELSLAGGSLGGPNDSYLSELLFRWAGWSLVAPRPGQHLSADPHQGLQPDANNPPTGFFPLQVAYAATPGTLGALRFGTTYRFRARAVDLAGNSIPFNPAATAVSFTYATNSLRYGRMEPVQSPPLVPHDPRGALSGGILTILSPGEHLERLVIRSEFYNTPDNTVGPTSRHVVPPSIAVEMAEAQGLLDSPGKTPDPAVYTTIAPLANATYADAAVVAALGGQADPGSSGQHYYDVNELAVPFLPDGLAKGAFFSTLPGIAAGLSVPFGDTTLTWPSTRGFRLEVLAGSAPPVVPSATNNYTLTVYAPKATFLTTRLSCYLDPADLDSMGLWEWLEEAGFATASLKTLAASGEMFWFTPYREVMIVHAVRQPLTVPQFTSPAITRAVGKTFALLGDTVEVDFASSQKIDVYSLWDEPFDDGVNPAGSVMLNFNAAVGEVRFDLTDDTSTSVTFPAVGPPAIPALRHDFGDTKYRLVYYEARSTTRFLEYFELNVRVTLTNTTPATADAGGMATGTVVVSSVTTPEVIYEGTVDYTEDDAAGTITAILGGAILPPVGGTATVNVRYVQPPVTRSSFETIVPPATATGYPLGVPSTARPAAPDVRYVLPLFAFADSTGISPPSIQSKRSGSAVRVYLGRPWWSSGDGEQLGVVIYHSSLGGTPIPPTPYEPFSTRYGRDPLFETNPVQIRPTLANFIGTSSTASLLTLPETGAAAPIWDIAGFDVQFDTSHQLWFADVEIDTSASGGVFSYWPFVRLALVRYQPNSLAGVECSPLVVADFVKLASDRTATLTFPTTTTVDLSIVGVGYTSGPAPESGPSVMYATVEKLMSGVTDPDLQWTGVPGSQIQLSPAFLTNDRWNWTGTVPLPAPRGSQSFRIRIEEFELIPSAVPITVVPPPAMRRTYIDTIEL
jgi:hypothetical protein